MMSATENLNILQHALGLDGHGQGRSYRNHFVATEDGDDFAACEAHVAAGRMTRHGPGGLFGGPSSYCFVVTDVGRQHVADNSPPPPKLTRSQRRYREYLAQDTDISFEEWLKCRR